MKYVKRFQEIMKDDSGQGMLEYVMLLAVVAAMVLAFRGKITAKVNDLMGKVEGAADRVVE